MSSSLALADPASADTQAQAQPTNKKAVEFNLAQSTAAPSGAGGSPVPAGSCLPRMKFASPRQYFASLTPRTKATLGDEDYTEALREMRTLFPTATDSDMVPFIRVCKGNIKETQKLYADCLTWRSTMLPITRASCANVLSKGMFFFHGHDKEGRPLGYLTMRGHDPKTRDLDECLRAIIYQCEALIHSEEKEGKEFQVTIILDRNGTNKQNQDPDMMKLFFALFSERYPDKLRRVYVCPANFMFNAFWGVIKYSMPERVRNKVVMCGAEKDLLEYIDADQLLTSLGGKDTFDPTK